MNSPEVVDVAPMTELLPVPQSQIQKKTLFGHYFKSGLLLIGIYALIINQVQRNKKQTPFRGIYKLASASFINTEPPVKKENWEYQSASFLMSK